MVQKEIERKMRRNKKSCKFTWFGHNSTTNENQNDNQIQITLDLRRSTTQNHKGKFQYFCRAIRAMSQNRYELEVISPDTSEWIPSSASLRTALMYEPFRIGWFVVVFWICLLKYRAPHVSHRRNKYKWKMDRKFNQLTINTLFVGIWFIREYFRIDYSGHFTNKTAIRNTTIPFS